MFATVVAAGANKMQTRPGGAVAGCRLGRLRGCVSSGMMCLPLRWRGRSIKPPGCCAAGRSTMKRPTCAAPFATGTTLTTPTPTTGFGLAGRPIRLPGRRTRRNCSAVTASLPRFGGEARPVPGRARSSGRANIEPPRSLPLPRLERGNLCGLEGRSWIVERPRPPDRRTIRLPGGRPSGPADVRDR